MQDDGLRPKGVVLSGAQGVLAAGVRCRHHLPAFAFHPMTAGSLRSTQFRVSPHAGQNRRYTGDEQQSDYSEMAKPLHKFSVLPRFQEVFSTSR